MKARYRFPLRTNPVATVFPPRTQVRTSPPWPRRALLFHLRKLYERTRVIITTNLSFWRLGYRVKWTPFLGPVVSSTQSRFS